MCPPSLLRPLAHMPHMPVIPKWAAVRMQAALAVLGQVDNVRDGLALAGVALLAGAGLFADVALTAHCNMPHTVKTRSCPKAIPRQNICQPEVRSLILGADLPVGFDESCPRSAASAMRIFYSRRIAVVFDRLN